MAYLILLIGTALGTAGGYALYSGFDDLTTERGVALTLSGTIAISVALVVVGIGFLLLALSRVSHRIDALRVETTDLGRSILATLTEHLQPEQDVVYDEVNAFEPDDVQILGHAARDRGDALDRSERELGSAELRPPADPLTAIVSSAASYDVEHERPATSIDAPGALDATRSEINLLIEDLDVEHRSVEDRSIEDRSIKDLSAHHGLQSVAQDVATDRGPGEERIVDSVDASQAGSDHAPVVPTQAALGEVDLEPAGTVDAGPTQLQETASEASDDRHAPHASFADDLSDEFWKDQAGDSSTTPHGEAAIHPDRSSGSDAPTVDAASDSIGSYESAGVTYTLYADGSVVAQADKMREVYPSLEALRGAFERGESVFSA